MAAALQRPVAPTNLGRPRVAVVTHVFAPSVGGCELHHEIVANELQSSSDVEVFTADRMLSLPGGTNSPPSFPYPVHYLPSTGFFGEHLITPRSLWGALNRFDPDVIWSNQPSLSADLAALYARIRGVPWVATYHADLDPTRVYAALYNSVEARFLRGASTVLVNADNYRTRLEVRGVPGNHIRAVSPGVTIGRGTPPAVSGLGVTAGSTPGPEHPLLFVGGLDTARSYKRPKELLAAVRLLGDSGRKVYLVFVGDGDRRPELERVAREWGLVPFVKFRGQLSDADLAEQYHSAWALILPSSGSEGFGLVTLEAVYYGCPVVSSDEPAAGPMLEKAGCAVVFPGGDDGAMAEAIWRVWSEPALRHSMAERASRVGHEQTWQTAFPRIVGPILSAARIHQAARGESR